MSVASTHLFVSERTHTRADKYAVAVCINGIACVDVNFTLKWNLLSELIQFLWFRFYIIRLSLHFIRMINLLKWECKQKTEQIVTSFIECKIRPKKIPTISSCSKKNAIFFFLQIPCNVVGTIRRGFLFIMLNHNQYCDSHM